MRKILYILPIIALVLCVALVLMMTGYWTFPELNAPATTQPTTATQESTSASTGIPVWKPVDMISISLPKMNETIVNEDGLLLFYRTFQDVVVSSSSAQINKAITLDLLQRMDANSDIAAQLADLVQYYNPQYNWSAPYYEILYAPTRIDKVVLSLHAIEAAYSGNGEASNNQICVNYHMATGEVLTLSQILSEESGAQEGLLQAILAVLAENAQKWELFSDYQDVVTRYFQSYLQQESIWYFTGAGLNMCFAPYELAPHASGTITISIPYSDLAGILRNEMFPQEQSDVAASVQILDFASANLDGYNHFSECILDLEGTDSLIVTDTILYDVRLELHTPKQTEEGFDSVATVFAANCISSDDALVLRYTPSENATLLLRCRAGGEDRCFQVVSNSDGSVSLLPND